MEIVMRSFRFAIPVALVLTVGALAAAATGSARSTSSSCAPVLGAEVCTWVVMEGSTPIELGATIPLALIEAVPTDVEMVWPPQELAALPMPVEARTALGIDHLGINWEAHGHPPASFLTQHFDFHFYNIPESRVRQIDCADESKPEHLPAPYALPDIDIPGMGVLTGLCVPNMGMHAMPEDEVHETHPFEASMMLGYYAGHPIFFEPMVSRELLLSRSDFALEMPAVQNLPVGVRYPTEFRAEYVADDDAYRLVFGGFDGARPASES
jgi:hypothetical protein